jgi:hypothetical protein
MENELALRKHKIELFRQSKAPVDLEAYAGYQADWVKFFDAVMNKHSQDMERVHKLLEKGELRLNKKHNKKVEIEFPKHELELYDLCEKYKVPIMFAQRADGKGLVAILMDEL